jgi:hypothetical protein
MVSPVATCTDRPESFSVNTRVCDGGVVATVVPTGNDDDVVGAGGAVVVPGVVGTATLDTVVSGGGLTVVAGLGGGGQVVATGSGWVPCVAGAGPVVALGVVLADD